MSKSEWHFEEGSLYLGDALEIMNSLPEQSVDLTVTSPPYENARLYGELNFKIKGQEWVDWLVPYFVACLRITKGLVAMVVGHGKGARNWSGTPALLCADLIRAGINLRSPLWYKRNGIMGSGGSDWMRADMEWIVCATNTPDKLPFSDNTALGHPPKYAPGGAMSNRTKSGARVNQWGRKLDKDGNYSGSHSGADGRKKDGTLVKKERPSHKEAKVYDGVTLANPGNVINCEGVRAETGITDAVREEINRLVEEEGITQKEACKRLGIILKKTTCGTDKDGVVLKDNYVSPELANPGNIVECSDVIDVGAAGKGHCGSDIAHETDAPFPEKLPNFFIRSFCPPGGTILDCFMGSGTSIGEAIKTGRKFIGIDLRESQIELTKRRIIQSRVRKGLE